MLPSWDAITKRAISTQFDSSLDPDPGGLKRAKMKGKKQPKDK
jgi:hypothetical protein